MPLQPPAKVGMQHATMEWTHPPFNIDARIQTARVLLSEHFYRDSSLAATSLYIICAYTFESGVGAAGGAGGGTTFEALQGADKMWERVRNTKVWPSCTSDH